LLTAKESTFAFLDFSSGSVIGRQTLSDEIWDVAMAPNGETFIVSFGEFVQMYQVLQSSAWQSVMTQPFAISDFDTDPETGQVVTASNAQIENKWRSIISVKNPVDHQYKFYFLTKRQVQETALVNAGKNLVAIVNDRSGVYNFELSKPGSPLKRDANNARLLRKQPETNRLFYLVHGKDRAIEGSEIQEVPMELSSVTEFWNNDLEKLTRNEGNIDAYTTGNECVVVALPSAKLLNINIADKKVLATYALKSQLFPNGLVFSPFGLVAGDREGRLSLLELPSLKLLSEVKAHESSITAIAITNNGLLLSAGIEGTIKLWSIRDSQLMPLVSISTALNTVRKMVAVDREHAIYLLCDGEVALRRLDLRELQNSLSKIRLSY